ncbi:iron complex transport system ATP-binding protein [Hasllibacter halocynthiae]|uniref:Iron complex transport system ATP-binding protein n=1 Tax=Hasllibacter halocynthiae TaxID=595589 RepID=A0A2T0X9Z5_9RHOB|nr:heme ABC transporter ATP-binding protein [Hasllibacter halocynthiae]PRY95723.1 iron complex transport system ATP-binding protein [Hasllibacter halocynthiae]
MIAARGLRARLGRTEALRGVDLRARAGAVTALVGPNGSGKTTLLRRLSGELDGLGVVTLDGAAIAGMRPWELASRRAVLPQATRLAFPFTVIEVVRLGLAAGTEAARGGIAEAALARVGLSGFESRLFQELSGGEAQRVHFARVLAQVWSPVLDGHARWLLLDEPVAALDIAHQLEVIGIARDYAAAGGGVIAVMHDLNLTAMMADQVVLMAEGRVALAGPPGTVIADRPLSAAYGCAVRTGETPPGPFVLPHSCGCG